MSEIPASTRQTIGSRLDQNRGLGPGFDFMRVALATLVVLWHSIPVATGGNFAQTTRFLWFGDYGILAAFFALSGFLVSGSAQRLHIGNFLLNRGLRIFPALALEITLSALVLGPIFTSLALSAYFSDPRTYHYFTNIAGLINFYLPGVFDKNPDGQVNVSLWTVPHELGCYLIMTTLIVTRSLKRPWLVVLAAAAFAGIGLVMVLSGIQPGGPIRVFYARGSQLYLAFTLGVVIYLYRHRIPYSVPLALGSAAVCLVVAGLGPADALSYPVVSLLAGPPLIYLTMFLGVTDIPTPNLLRKGDYSYGIYLYGYPIQQSVKALIPGLTNPVALFVVAMLVIVPFAALSWHTLEKRILGLRRHFSFVARIREAPGEEGAAAETGTPGAAAATGGAAPGT